jgi:PIN domain nuclease of toxin-antitoxin system
LTNDLLLDTHIAIWLDDGDTRLRASTLDLIEAAWRRGGTVFVSAITSWEIAQLVFLGRINLDLPADAWIERFANHPGIEVIPLTHRAASRAYCLDGLEHRDPGDRLLIATAIERESPLVTYDARIVRFGETHGHQCGFATLG